MCRLFGMTAGTHEVHATYWLVDAPDSILEESHRNPDGTGMGWFDADGTAHIDKQPSSAFSDSQFTTDARSVAACSLITHIRAATTGQDTLVNTHPFLMDGLIVAHNGGFGDLPAVEAQLGPFAKRVQGDTDSERFAALIARHTSENDGDVGAGIAAAAGWLADNVPLYSLNCLVASPGNLWALRYPDQRAMHVARRRVTPSAGGPWQAASGTSNHRIESDELTEVVIFASERIDSGDDWRMLEPGELIHVGPDLAFTSRLALDRPPAHLHLLDEPDPNVDTF